jgi:hypothetical protein
VATLVKEVECKGDTNLTQREIDLAYGLKDKQESIYSPILFSFFEYYIDVYGVFFFLICIISKYKYVYQLTMHFLRVWNISVETPQCYVVQWPQISHQKVG